MPPPGRGPMGPPPGSMHGPGHMPPPGPGPRGPPGPPPPRYPF